MLTPDALAHIYNIFLGLGILVLVIGGIQIPLEAKDDYPLMARKLAFLIMTMLAIATFRPAVLSIHKISLAQRDIARDEMLREDYMKKLIEAELKKTEKDKQKSSWFMTPWIMLKVWFSEMFEHFGKGLLRILLMIPNTIRSFSCSIIEMVLTASFIISPMMIAMLTVRQTEGAGWRFVMASLALAVSPIIFPVADYIFVNFCGRIAGLCISVCLPSSIAGAVALTEAITAVSAFLSSNPFGWGITIFLICVLILMILFFLLFLTFGYFIVPFVFVKVVSSGDVASNLSGAFSFMTGYAQRTASMGIEGAEAGARTMKKSSDVKAAAAKQEQAVGDVVRHAGVDRAGAVDSLRMSGGQTLPAIEWAEKGLKNGYYKPATPEDMGPAGMKKPT